MYITGTLRALSVLVVVLDQWYRALSIRMTVFSRHRGLALSSCSTSYLKKMSITLPLELDCRSDR